VEVLDGMEHVAQPGPDKPYIDCNCHRSDKGEKVMRMNAKVDMNTRDEL
jgi:hypothetical protein